MSRYFEPPTDRDLNAQFTLTCGGCGRERSNLDGDGTCSCGASSESYSSADAERWNRRNDWADRYER